MGPSLLSEWCVVTSFYQSLQAMSSFMRFSICATYCTLSPGEGEGCRCRAARHEAEGGRQEGRGRH